MRIGINVKTQSYMYFMNTNDEAKYDAKKKIIIIILGENSSCFVNYIS